MRAAVLFALLGSCTWSYGSSSGDDNGDDDPVVRPDAYIPPYMPPTSCGLGYIEATWRCIGSTASILVTNYNMGAGTHSMCTSTLVQSSVTCTAGCAVEGTIKLTGNAAFSSYLSFGNNAAVFCAETPAATPGDACSSTKPCLPTRATLAADGTVASHSYLACNSTSNTCVSAAGPPLITYTDPCDAMTIDTYAVPNTTGAAGSGANVCLIAWDEMRNMSVWNQTTQCLGDWQCPAGMLCDDELDRLPASAEVIGVCKPGPRGTLTPAMLK